MKTINKRPRKLMRVRNRNRVNRARKQQIVLFPVFIMVLIRLALEKENTPEKLLARMRMHILKLTGNVFFPVTDPTVAAQTALAAALEDAIDEVNAGNNSEIPTRDALVADGKEMIRQLSYNIQYLSKGNEEKIKSAGFDVRKIPGVAPDPGQVQHLSSKALGGGKVKLNWDKEPGSVLYIIERCQNLAINKWDLVKKVRRKTFTVENLIPGQVYYFHVYGTNGTDDGVASDPVEQRVL